MKDLTTITEVIEAFKHRGFKFIGKTDEGKFRLQGQLIPPQSEKGYLSEIELDPQFLNLPRIRLLEIPPQLPKVIPHMDENRNLCYIAQGRLVLDIFDPIGQSIACLERASNVLGQIIKGEMVEDLVEEFFAYWKGWSCWIDLQSKNLGEQHCIVAENFDERSRWFITDDTERTNKKLKSFGYQTTDRTVLTYRIKTSAQPRPLTNNWPPKTVADILTWQGALDPKCRRKIHQRILDGKRKKVCGGVLILIESPLITYGFNVNYNLQNLIPETKPAYLNDPIYGLKIYVE